MSGRDETSDRGASGPATPAERVRRLMRNGGYA